MGASMGEQEPGDRGAIMAALAAPWLRDKADVVIHPGVLTVLRLTPKGLVKEHHEQSAVSEAQIRSAIEDLAAGAAIEEGMTRDRRVTIDGQAARLVLSPWCGLLGLPGLAIYYRWLPNG